MAKEKRKQEEAEDEISKKVLGLVWKFLKMRELQYLRL